MSRFAEPAATGMAAGLLRDVEGADRVNAIRVLHLEDNIDDQEIIKCSLAEGAFAAASCQYKPGRNSKAG
jgi:hypothetical protein